MVVLGNRFGILSWSVGACVLAICESAAACGGGAIVSQAGVVVNSQRVVISVRSTEVTDIVAQIGVPSTTSDYGVLIPVPSEPSIDSEPVSALELSALDSATAPRIEHEVYSGHSGPSCTCGGDDDDAKSGGTPTRGVTASPPVEIGPVEAVSLTGDSADAINAWLTEHGFVLPSDDAATLAHYVAPSNYFIAIRRSEAAATGAPSSIGIHYSLKGVHRKLSLEFARIGAASKVAFTVFVANSEAVGPSTPFKALTLDSLDSTLLRNGDYQGAVERAVSSSDSKAFVVENVFSPSLISRQAPSIAALIDPAATVTRSTTVVAREALTVDAIFASPPPATAPNTRWVSRNVFRSHYAGFGPLGLLVLAGLRRRGRTS